MPRLKSDGMAVSTILSYREPGCVCVVVGGGRGLTGVGLLDKNGSNRKILTAV